MFNLIFFSDTRKNTFVPHNVKQCEAVETDNAGAIVMAQWANACHGTREPGIVFILNAQWWSVFLASVQGEEISGFLHFTNSVERLVYYKTKGGQ